MGLSKIQVPGEEKELVEKAENKSPVRSWKRQELNTQLDVTTCLEGTRTDLRMPSSLICHKKHHPQVSLIKEERLISCA